jgi:hypothetical protein
VTFTTQTVQGPSSCTNGTGLTATVAATGTIANGTTSSNTSTTTSGTAATASHTNAAAFATNAAWSVMGAAVLGAVALL